MLKIISTIVTVTVVAAAAIWGVNTLLSIDDIADCKMPDLLSAKCAPADVIVAISGGDTPARTAEAIRLYQVGWAPKVVFSGAALDPAAPSNAEVMRAQAVKAGVPQTAIAVDEIAVDTAQNAAQTQRLIGDAKRVILVTSPYHQRRASIEFARFSRPDVTIVNHPTSTDRQWNDLWWTTSTGWFLALSECIKTLVVMVQK